MHRQDIVIINIGNKYNKYNRSQEFQCYFVLAEEINNLMLASKRLTTSATLSSPRSQQKITQFNSIPLDVQAPLFECLKSENACFIKQKQQIERQMQVLVQIALNLKRENQNLHQHFTSRSKDMHQILETLAINVSEEESDLLHQRHLYKEVKLRLLKENQRKEEILSKLMENAVGQQLKQLNNNKRKQALKTNNLLAKNKFIKDKIIRAEKKLQQLDINSLQNDVSKLVLQINQLRQNIEYKSKKMYQIEQNNERQKPIMQASTQIANQTTKELINQLNQLAQQSIKCEKLQARQLSKANSTYTFSLTLYQQLNKNKRKLQNIMAQIDFLQQNICKIKFIKGHLNKPNLNQTYEQLQHQRNKIKQDLQELRSYNRQNYLRMQQNQINNIKLLQEQSAQTKKQFQYQIENILYTNKKLIFKIKQKKQQYQKNLVYISKNKKQIKILPDLKKQILLLQKKVKILRHYK